MSGLWRALVCAAVIAVAGCAGPNRSESGEDGPGYLYYFADGDGYSNLWAVSDSGGQPILLGHRLAPEGKQAVAPMVSPDGQRLLLWLKRDANGELGETLYAWLLDLASGELSYLGAPNPEGLLYGVSWYGDSRHALYADNEVCSNNLVRLDTSTGRTEIVYAVEDIAAAPSVNPHDDSDVVFSHQRCAEHSTLMRLNTTTQSAERIAGFPEQTSRGRSAQWSLDGTLIAYRVQHSFFVHDLEQEAMVFVDADVEAAYQGMTWGSGDRALYAKRCLPDGCDLVAIDLSRGDMRALGVANVTRDSDHTVSWGPATVDLEAMAPVSFGG